MEFVFYFLSVVMAAVVLIVLVGLEMTVLHLLKLDHERQRYSDAAVVIIAIAMALTAFVPSWHFAYTFVPPPGDHTILPEPLTVSAARSIQIYFGAFAVLAIVLMIRSHLQRVSNS